MAEFNLTPLARALSQPQLVLTETTVDVSPRSLPLALQPSRRRKLTSVNSIESLESLTSPSAAEARVLVINTGGTIGMTLRDDGNRSSRRSLRSLSCPVASWADRLRVWRVLHGRVTCVTAAE